MAETLRAGGYIDRGDGRGWVVDDTPAPAPPRERPRQHRATGPTTVGGWTLTAPAAEAHAELQRVIAERDDAEARARHAEAQIPVKKAPGRPRKEA